MEYSIFYTAPTNAIFNELKQEAEKIWMRYDDTYGYATEKVLYIRGLDNIGSNFMTIFQMFDTWNQITLKEKVSQECRDAILVRLQ